MYWNSKKIRSTFKLGSSKCIKYAVFILLITAVLKLGVATLLRVANFQKRVAKLWNWQFLSPIWLNSSQIKALLCNILHLKGPKISKNKYRGRQQKMFENPCHITMVRQTLGSCFVKRKSFLVRPSKHYEYFLS